MKLKSQYIKLKPEMRLYKLGVPVIGLTGGIATGKSTVSRMLKERGLVIIDADKLVKDVYALSESKEFIKKNFPNVMNGSEIDFTKLRKDVFSNENSRHDVEAFIYPKLEAAFKQALAPNASAEVLVYDVPLLFERQLERYFDLKVLVYAPRKIQHARLLKRDGNLESMADQILDQQIDIEAKRLKADVIIDNSQTEAELVAKVDNFVRTYFA